GVSGRSGRANMAAGIPLTRGHGVEISPTLGLKSSHADVKIARLISPETGTGGADTPPAHRQNHRRSRTTALMAAGFYHPGKPIPRVLRAARPSPYPPSAAPRAFWARPPPR